MTGRALRALGVAAATWAAAACFATRGDVRVLQGDIAVLRAEAARGDSINRERLRALAGQIGAVADTLKEVNAFLARFVTDVSHFQADVATSLRSIGQQMLAVQELTGQSQKRLQEMRADLESRQAEMAVAAAQPPGAAAPAGAAPAGPTAPGPHQLYQLARQQLDRFSWSAARAGFEEFLAQYPAHALAAESQFGIAEAYAGEGNPAAADSAYALVVARYPKSDRAPTALYKRALPLVKVPGQKEKARALFQQIVEKYPGSPEKILADDYLRILK